MVHMIECENPLMTKFISSLLAKSREKGSYYRGIWVIHYQEDVAYRAYLNWSCKRIGDQTETTVSSMAPFDRQAYIYESMVKVGEKSAEGKDNKQIALKLKEQFCQCIPVGEQLASVVQGDHLFPLSEWCDYMFETPDICLERELQWPDKDEKE